MTSLTVVIVALTDKGRVEIVKSIRLICERKTQGGDSVRLSSESWHLVDHWRFRTFLQSWTETIIRLNPDKLRATRTGSTSPSVRMPQSHLWTWMQSGSPQTKANANRNKDPRRPSLSPFLSVFVALSPWYERDATFLCSSDRMGEQNRTWFYLADSRRDHNVLGQRWGQTVSRERFNIP